MMNATTPRKTSIIAFAAVGLAALLLLLTVRMAGAVDPPVITGISPASGPTTGGTIVTITGTGFPPTADVAVTFNGADAGATVNVAGTVITAVAPPGAPGLALIRVTNTAITASDSRGDLFTYVGPPLVIGLSPSTAPAASTVTIFGTGFAAGATVKFGAASATEVTVVSANKITAKVPAGTGTVDVTVTNSDAQTHTLDDAFTYGAGGGGGGVGTILAGSIPLSGGFGLIVFGGGTNAQLVTASGCPQATATFYATNTLGGFVTYIPGSGVAAVNAAWNAMFATGIPSPSALIGKCV